MSLEEGAAIVLCLFLGYWVVSLLYERRNSRAPEQAQAGSAESQPQASWAAILGVAQDADMEEIRRAYLARISEYHPGKVAALGAELRALAERKLHEINLAYAEACRARDGRP